MYFLHGMLHARTFFMLAMGTWLATTAKSQDSINLTNLTNYRSTATGWQMAGDVIMDLKTANSFRTSPGTTILYNTYSEKQKPTDLFTSAEHGDADISLDFMMARGSNSGIFLQGNYEIQLFDSWGKTNVNAGDNGAVYQRWDESRGAGKQGFEGMAPRQSVSKAPGLWQHLEISFQAPVFDASGNKLSNAKILRAALNGVLIHEQVEISGPTHGGDGKEKPMGPLRLQGDHGAVAFRNISITNYNRPKPVLSDLQYAVYKTASDRKLISTNKKSLQSGKLTVLSATMNNLPDTFLLQYKGTLSVSTPGTYQFRLSTAAGLGSMFINNKEIALFNRPSGRAKSELPAGDHPFEIRYSKSMDWAKPAVALQVSGPGIREFLISDQNTNGGDPVDPILISASTNTVLRSFIDLPEKRIVHAVSVGSPEGTHYTYDLDNGALIQAWHGGFLDATPMWHERGDGSSRPAGSVEFLGKPAPGISTLATADAAWATDTTGTGYKPKGYVLDAEGRPAFK
ncbi:MAG: DUF1080 domain-containing protein, partial [Sphingobacteriales bacterium]